LIYKPKSILNRINIEKSASAVLGGPGKPEFLSESSDEPPTDDMQRHPDTNVLACRQFGDASVRADHQE
jgi:hypothetical protein